MLCPRRQGKFDEGEERRGKEMKREERQRGGKEKTVTLKLIFLWEVLILSLNQCFV